MVLDLLLSQIFWLLSVRGQPASHMSRGEFVNAGFVGTEFVAHTLCAIPSCTRLPCLTQTRMADQKRSGKVDGATAVRNERVAHVLLARSS